MSSAKVKKQLNQIIDSELSVLAWGNMKYTTYHKSCALQSIKNLLNNKGFIEYLVKNSRSGGYQNKLFHEFISLMDGMIPFTCKKAKEDYTISSITDPRLNIFSGENSFKSIVINGVVKNKTSKFYIGGRKATYARRYYIGRLLSITDDFGNNLFNSVQSFSFEKIYLYGINDHTSVTVKHLMVIPHYQMGAMLYINKARNLIVKKYHNIIDI